MSTSTPCGNASGSFADALNTVLLQFRFNRLCTLLQTAWSFHIDEHYFTKTSLIVPRCWGPALRWQNNFPNPQAKL